MRKFSTGGYTFYILDRDERGPNPLDDTGFYGAYLIWPFKNGFWNVCQFENGDWKQITSDLFGSENEAFNHVYCKHCERYNQFFLKN